MKFNKDNGKEGSRIKFFFLSKVVRDQKGNWPIWSGFWEKMMRVTRVQDVNGRACLRELQRRANKQ